MAREAVVRLTWLRSVSDDVVEQRLVLNGTEPVVLLPTVEEFVVNVPDKGSLNVVLTAYDGTNVSLPVTLDFLVGDLTPPQPPIGLMATIVDVVDVE
jgi:hypothetical protein